VTKHTVAINLLKDELDDIVRTVKEVRGQGISMRMQKMVFPDHFPAVQSARELKYQHILKDLIDRGNSLVESIKALERLEKGRT